MKRLLLSVVFLLTSILVFSQVQRSMVILEISTGTWCQYCPGASIGAEMLVSGGASVAVIKYHNGDPYANTASNARNTYYSIPGYPNAQFDGPNNSGGGNLCNGGNQYSTYLAKYNQRIAVQSPMTVDISGTNDGNTYNIILSINKKSTFTGTNPRVFLVLTESNITTSSAWPPTGQCMTEVDYVERLMVPNESGTSISFTSGDFQIINLSFTKDASWVSGNCELVAFVQDYYTKEIFNGTKVALNALPAPVSVNFTGTPTTGCSPLLVDYNSTGAGVNSFQWSFPGGTPSTSSSANPDVNYNSIGSFNVTLTAWNSTTNRGNKKTVNSYITTYTVPGSASQPTGATNLIINPSDQTYTTNLVSVATSYVWDLQPPTAGVITPSGTTCSINWDDTFTGNAELKVKASNNCGDGPWSSSLNIKISPPEFHYTIANDVQTSDRKLEFDLYLLNVQPADSFELAIIQAGILISSEIINGGTLTASIIPGSSELVSAQQPTSITWVTGTPNGCIKIAAKPGPQCGNGTIIDTTGLGTRICRVRVTNSVPFTASSRANLAFNFTISPYPTKVFRYTGTPCSGVELTCSSSNSFSLASNILLNGPPSLSVSPSDQAVSSSAGTTIFSVTSTAAWTATSNQTWCTVNPSGFGNGTITANYSENTGTSPRVANITVRVTGLTSIIVTVTQAVSVLKTVNLTAFLEGLYTGSNTMHPAMDASGPHWGEFIADKLTIELHEETNYSNIVYTANDVSLSPSGMGTFTLPSLFNSNYYLTIRHRNHILTTTSSPISFSSSTINYAFDMPSKAFGNNMVLMTGGNWAFYAGDVNQDGIIDGSDLSDIGNKNDLFSTGYLPEDVNGDGLVDGSDMNISGNNNDLFIGVITP